MKKLLGITILVLTLACLLVSCFNNDTPDTNGEQDPQTHTHAFSQWETTLAPSCTAAGEQARSCSCGEKETQAILPSAHPYGDWTIEKQATCGEEGIFTRACTVCGASDTQKIAPTGTHRQVEDAAVAATCTSTGLSSGVHCGDCGMVIIAQQILPIIDHTYSSENDGTCNKCGFVRDVVCAHESVITLSAVEPKCTSSGLTEGKKCANCGDIIVSQDEIPALGHTEVVEDAKQPTCTEPGHTAGKTCSVCDTVLLQKTEIPASGHRSGEWLIEIEPTESTEGLKYKICTLCETRFDDTSIPFVGANGLAYQPNDIGNTCTVTGIGTFAGEELIIPDYIAGYRVTAIADYAFKECTKLKKLVLPETVKTIGEGAFYGCTGLTEFTIPASVTYMGDDVINGCNNMTTLYYNSTFGKYYQGVHGCYLSSLKKIVFNGSFVPADVISRSGSYIEEVVIGNNVTEIKDYAFYQCYYLKSVSISNSVTSIGNGAFHDCDSLTEIIIPGSVETIGANAFYDCNALKTVILSYGVTTLGNSAFYSCNSLESIELPESLTSIGTSAFSSCSNLKTITLPSSITQISQGMFSYSGITSIVIPGSITTIGSSAFYGCKLVNVVIPDSVTTIERYAFENCSILTGIVIPRSVTTIDYSAFNGCVSLTDVYYTGSVDDWTAMTVGSNNTYLLNAEIYYNYKPKS